MTRAGSAARLVDDGLGVSRFDLPPGRDLEDDATALVRRWGQDRALPAATVEDLCVLTCAALAPHGGRDPHGVCVRLQWADLDHVRVEVEWRGPVAAVTDEVRDEALRASADIMDTTAVRWGVDQGPGLWMIVDAGPVQ